MIKSFFNSQNIRPYQFGWLLYVHILGLAGLIYTVINYQALPMIVGTHLVIHSIYTMGITAGCHRLWSHKSYYATTPLKIFLMLLNSGMFQGSIFAWSRDHRLHHKYSDTDLDPHTIKRGFFFSHVGWLLEKKSQKIIEEGRNINMNDLINDPVVMFQKKYYYILAILMTFVVPSYIYSFIVPIIPAFLLSMWTYVVTLNCTWCVNSICHMFGSRPWNPKIQPADNYLVSLVTGGEGYHNWHHEYPSDWRGSKDSWYMINTTARFIQLCCLLRLAKVKC